MRCVGRKNKSARLAKKGAANNEVRIDVEDWLQDPAAKTYSHTVHERQLQGSFAIGTFHGWARRLRLVFQHDKRNAPEFSLANLVKAHGAPPVALFRDTEMAQNTRIAIDVTALGAFWRHRVRQANGARGSVIRRGWHQDLNDGGPVHGRVWIAQVGLVVAILQDHKSVAKKTMAKEELLKVLGNNII